jgi:dihydrodipicolinate synthase/N-acetylneuraminate lyase
MASKKRYPPAMLTTALIPWTEDFQFDESLFRKEIKHIVGTGIRHVYIMGTAGEGYDVNTEEYSRIVKAFYEEMNQPGLHAMVCVISVSTQLIIERIRIAYRIGIREFQLVLPCWGVLNDQEMMLYFHTVCDQFPDCRFMIYNIGRAGRVLELEQFMRIAEEIPNIVAVKNTQPNMVMLDKLLRSDCPLQFFVTESGWAYASTVGECGYLVAIAAPNPKMALTYFEAGLRHDQETLYRCQAELLDIMHHLIKVVGNAMDGTYDKMTMKLCFPEMPLRLRPPYRYPSEADFEKHRDFIRSRFPDWNV